MTAQEAPSWSTSTKWLIGLLSFAVAALALWNPALDVLSKSQEVADYGYCEGLYDCLEQSASASAILESTLPRETAEDCAVAGAAASARLAFGRQSARVREGFCVVTAAAIGEQIGATYWVAPWVNVNKLPTPPPAETPSTAATPTPAPTTPTPEVPRDCSGAASALEELRCKYGD